MPALQYNPTNNNNSDYINPIPSTSGTQKKSEIPPTSIKQKKSENNELLPKKSKIHIKGKNSFLTNKNPKKRKNIEKHSNLNAKKEKLEYNPRKRKNTNIILNEFAKKEKLEHNPRKRKNNKEIFNINAKKGKYKTLTMEHNPRKRKNSEDIFNNINIKKRKYDSWPSN